MSVLAGRGPLTADRAGRFVPPLSGDRVDIEAHPRRVHAIRNEHSVIVRDDDYCNCRRVRRAGR